MIFFFIIVTVVLSNLILAMVTSANDESRQTRPQVELCERVLNLYGRRPIHGRIMVLLLNLSTITKKRIPFLSRSRDRAILIGNGRCLFPSEVMVTEFPPLRSARILDNFNYGTLNRLMYSSLFPWIIETHGVFQEEGIIRSKEDKLLSANEELAYVSKVGEVHATLLRYVRTQSIQRRLPIKASHLLGLRNDANLAPQQGHLNAKRPLPLFASDANASPVNPSAWHALTSAAAPMSRTGTDLLGLESLASTQKKVLEKSL